MGIPFGGSACNKPGIPQPADFASLPLIGKILSANSAGRRVLDLIVLYLTEMFVGHLFRQCFPRICFL
jgi:hypothetical protein